MYARKNAPMWQIEYITWTMYYEPLHARFTMFNRQENVWCDLFLDDGIGIVEEWSDWKEPYYPNLHLKDRRNTGVLKVREQRAILNAIFHLKANAPRQCEAVQRDIRNIVDALYRILAL